MTAGVLRDDAEDVDAAICALAPGLTPPQSVPSAAVLVVGPWLAGVSSLVAALRHRMPKREFVEFGELPPDTVPAAVVFAVSAVAPLVPSDCAVLDEAVRHTDLVIGALTKIDAHRNWRAVLRSDAAAVGAHAPRLRDIPWVGVAAAAPRGGTDLEALVDVLATSLSQDTIRRRNRLRAWETHLSEQIGAISAGRADPEAAQWHGRRDEVLRELRLSRSVRAVTLRSRMQQARVQLGCFARNRCASVRTELSEDAATWGALHWGVRRRAREFHRHAAHRAATVVEDVDGEVTEQLRDIAAELGFTAPAAPPAAPAPELGAAALSSRRLEMQLMTALGAGFGLGVAMAAGRLFTGLAPGPAVAGAIAGGLLGVLLTVWVVGIRGLLHDRAQLDRWVGRVAAVLRESTEALVATRVLAAEVELTAQAAAADERAAAQATGQLDVIDARLRERAVAAAHAQSCAQRRLPALHAALEGVRAALIIR